MGDEQLESSTQNWGKKYTQWWGQKGQRVCCHAAVVSVFACNYSCSNCSVIITCSFPVDSRKVRVCACVFVPAVYHAIYLEELTATELTEKIAQLFNISPRQINQIFKQGPTGIHVLVSDEVRPWLTDRSESLQTLVSSFSLFPICCKHKKLFFTDDSELPGWSVFCTGHNERYLWFLHISHRALSCQPLFITPSISVFPCPDDTNDGYHIILKWMQSGRKASLCPSAPPELHAPRCSWNMWKCPEKPSKGWREEHVSEALSLLYLTVLLSKERLLQLPSSSPPLALPLSPMNDYMYVSWTRLVMLQLLSLSVSGASAVPKLVYRLFENKNTQKPHILRRNPGLANQSQCCVVFSSSRHVDVRKKLHRTANMITGAKTGHRISSQDIKGTPLESSSSPSPLWFLRANIVSLSSGWTVVELFFSPDVPEHYLVSFS